MKRFKKAFTIVELVIVIAVIAVLAAVLIPTFVSLVDRANISADTQTVSNLNKILVLEETTNGRKAGNLNEALAQVAENGYSVEKLTPTGDSNDILWEQSSNRFALVTKEGEVLYRDAATTAEPGKSYWVISDQLSSVYSTRLTENYTGGAIQTDKGVDVSAVSSPVDITIVSSVGAANAAFRGGIAAVAFTESSEPREEIALLAESDAIANLIVFANGGSLTVNTELSGATVCTFGSVGAFEVTNGTVEIYNTTIAQFTCTTHAESVAVSFAGNVTITTSYVTNGAVSAAITQSTTVTIEQELTEAPSPENTTDFAGGNGTKAFPYLIASLQNLKNIAKLESEMKKGASYYFKQTADITITGTAAEYYNVIGDYSVVDYMRGGYDGAGHRLSSEVAVSGATAWFSVFYYSYDVEYKNIEFYLGAYWFQITSQSKGKNILFTNINTYNQGSSAYVIPGNNYGTLIGFSQCNITVQNCTNYANFESQNAAAIWLGTPSFNYKIIFDSCVNNGDLYGIGGLFAGNSGGDYYIGSETKIRSNLEIKNCKNNGSLIGSQVGILGYTITTAANLPNAKAYQEELMATGAFGTVAILNETKDLITKDQSGLLSLSTVNNAARYELELSGYYHLNIDWKEKDQGHGKFILKFTYTSAGSTNEYKAWFIDSKTAEQNENLVNSDGTKLYTRGKRVEDEEQGLVYYVYTAANDITYYVIENFTQGGKQVYIDQQVSVNCMVYNSAGQLIAYSRSVQA